MKLKAELSVADANRSLSEAVEKVKQLKKEHLVEVKSLRNPPAGMIIYFFIII